MLCNHKNDQIIWKEIGNPKNMLQILVGEGMAVFAMKGFMIPNQFMDGGITGISILLHTAALWHDTGYISTYKNHEEESCKLARQYLPEYGYSPLDIDKVCSLTMVTKIPQTPNNKLDKILAETD